MTDVLTLKTVPEYGKKSCLFLRLRALTVCDFKTCPCIECYVCSQDIKFDLYFETLKEWGNAKV